MKKFKKIMAVLVAAIMVVAMTVPAWAATITIDQTAAETNSTVGAETYNMYKIFDVTKTASTIGNTTDDTVNKDTDANYTSVGTISSNAEWDAQAGTGESAIPLYLRNEDGTFTKKTAYDDTNDKGKTFYKLNETEGAVYTIKDNSPWYTVLNKSGQNWVTLTPTTKTELVLGNTVTTYLVEWKNDDHSVAQTRKFAQWLLTNKDVGINPDETMTTTPSNKTATKEVANGYWLITSSLGTELVLATSNITIKTKNSFPSTEKTSDDTDYNVGDFVEYTITVRLPASTDFLKPIIVHETMSDKLKLTATKSTTSGDHGWSAKEGESNVFTSHVELKQDAVAAGDKTELEAYYAGRATDPKTHDTAHIKGSNEQIFDFIIDVSSLAPEAGTEPAAKVITITYYAELLGEAALRTAIPNKEYVEYSKYKTPEATRDVKTYGFDITKTFEGTHANNITANFELKPADFTANQSGGTYYKKNDEFTLVAPDPSLDTKDEIEYAGYEFNTDAGAAKKYALTESTAILFEKDGWAYTKKDSNSGTTSSTITVQDNTLANLKGLDSGVYTLTETATADGYKPLTSPIVVRIAKDGTTSVISAPKESQGFTNYNLSVVNETSSVLPATGGMGTTVLYIVGGMLVILAGAYLFFSRKKTA